MNDWIGKSLGKVRIDSLLARGGMAEVYLGTHTTLKRQVAVKILRTQYEDDPELLERFEREAQVVAKLRHHNIVQVFDFDSIDDRPYIVMEYVAGPSLSQYLSVLHKNNLKVELTDITKILTGVANALQYAHESGVIHRDIKPGNIILTSRIRQITAGETLPRDFEAVLTDFGLVRFLNSSRQTSAGQTAGTPAYMSPEQARGETTDARTDIYSLGIVLYEMLAGKVPFDGETTVSILLKHIADPLPPIRDLPNPLQKVLEKALAKNPPDRYQTATKLASAFKAATEAKAEQNTFMEITPVTDPAAIPYTDPAQSLIIVNPPPKPRWNWMPAALGAVALVLFGVIYLVIGARNAPPAAPQTTATNTVMSVIPVSGTLNTLNSTAILHLRDGDVVMDQAFLEAFALQLPQAGMQYEVVLLGSGESLNIGVLKLDSKGKGTRTYTATTGENLLAKYDQVELIAKPLDASSGATEQVAYSYTLPADGLVYIRQLLVSDPETPDQAALIQGLSDDTDLLQQSVSQMQEAYATGNQADARMNAESIINLIVGAQSPEYKDWNIDGQISDAGSGYGFLLNGSNQGYVQAVFSHADYVANSAGASQNMIERSGEVQTCTENLAQWLPRLKEQAQKIANATSLADMEKPVQEAMTLAKNIHNGADINGNLKIELLTGECGVVDLYRSAYAMADMPLLPVNSLGTPTATAGTGTPSPIGTIINVTVTPKPSINGGGGGANTPVPPQPTKKPNPGGGGGGNTPPGHEKTPKP
jgi:serine/threonine protein kinase